GLALAALLAGCASSTPAAASSPEGEADLILRAQAVRSQALVAEAQEAHDAGDFARAASLYEQAIILDPSNETAQQGRAIATAEPDNFTPVSLLDRYTTEQRILSEHSLAEYQQWMDRARAALAAGKYDQANEAVTLVRLSLERNRRYL